MCFIKLIKVIHSAEPATKKHTTGRFGEIVAEVDWLLATGTRSEPCNQRPIPHPPFLPRPLITPCWITHHMGNPVGTDQRQWWKWKGKGVSMQPLLPPAIVPAWSPMWVI